jgi:hypothetical protein
MFEVPTLEGGPEPPEEALRDACEGVGAPPPRSPGAAEPEDLADIEGGHYPPAVALTRLATQKTDPKRT